MGCFGLFREEDKDLLLLPSRIPLLDGFLLLLLSELPAVSGALWVDCFEEREVLEDCALIQLPVAALRALSDRVAKCTGLECNSNGLPLLNSRGGTTSAPAPVWCEVPAKSWLRFKSDVVAGRACMCVHVHKERTDRKL